MLLGLEGGAIDVRELGGGVRRHLIKRHHGKVLLLAWCFILHRVFFFCLACWVLSTVQTSWLESFWTTP